MPFAEWLIGSGEIFLRLVSVVAVGGCGLIDFQWPTSRGPIRADAANRLNPHLSTIFGAYPIVQKLGQEFDAFKVSAH
jgi:hypothetical protein